METDEQEQYINQEKRIEKPDENDETQQQENQETVDESNQDNTLQAPEQITKYYGGTGDHPEVFKLTNQNKGWEVHMQSSVYDTSQLADIFINFMTRAPNVFDKFFLNGNKSQKNGLTK